MSSTITNVVPLHWMLGLAVVAIVVIAILITAIIGQCREIEEANELIEAYEDEIARLQKLNERRNR